MVKPKVLISACLYGLNYRYNGEKINYPVVGKLSSIINLVPLCPEVEVGLGIPRFPIKLIKSKQGLRMIQAYTFLDVTSSIKRFSKRKIKEEYPFHGLIVKSKSPSCSAGDAKVYTSISDRVYLERRRGVFTNILIRNFPYIPVISEEATDKELDEFLIKVFILYAFSTYGTNILIKEYYPLLKAFNPGLKRIVSSYDVHRTLKRSLRASNYIKILNIYFKLRLPFRLYKSYIRGYISRRELARIISENRDINNVKLKRYLIPYPLYNT